MSAGTGCACGRFTIPASGMVPISDGVWHCPVRSDLCEIVMLREGRIEAEKQRDALLEACRFLAGMETWRDLDDPEFKQAREMGFGLVRAAIAKAEGRS